MRVHSRRRRGRALRAAEKPEGPWPRRRRGRALRGAGRRGRKARGRAAAEGALRGAQGGAERPEGP